MIETFYEYQTRSRTLCSLGELSLIQLNNLTETESPEVPFYELIPQLTSPPGQPLPPSRPGPLGPAEPRPGQSPSHPRPGPQGPTMPRHR